MNLQKEIQYELEQIIKTVGLPVVIRKEKWSPNFVFRVERVENETAYGTALKDGREYHRTYGDYSYKLFEKFYLVKSYEEEQIAEAKKREAARIQEENAQELAEAQKESERVISAFRISDIVRQRGAIVDKKFESRLSKAVNPSDVAEEERNHLFRIIRTIRQLIEKQKERITNPEKPAWYESETTRGGVQINPAINDYVTELESNAGFETDVASLEETSRNPYFFHMSLQFEDEQEPENVFVGERLVYDGREPTVISWQSPLGALAYDRDKTSIVVNRKYRADIEFKRNVVIRDGVLNDVVEIYNRQSKMSDEDEAMVYDEFLVRVLREKRSHKELTNIIPSIQSNQNQIIRAPQRENLIVQGCAGCGKTMILLHRISYLLYNYPQISQSSYLVISPSKQFNRHLLPLLRNLRITNVSVRSVPEYYIEMLCSYHSTWKEIADDSRLFSDISIDEKYVKYFYSEEYARKLQQRVAKRVQESKENEQRINSLAQKRKELKDQFKDASETEREINRLKLQRRISIFDDAFKDILPTGMKPGNRKIPICRAELYATLLVNYFCYGARTTFPFVFIDEGQDLSKQEYVLIKSINQNSVMNIYGDLDQQIHSYSIGAWEDLNSIGSFSRYSINENYRNTINITTFVNSELMMEMTGLGLDGPEPDLISVEELRAVKRRTSLTDRKAVIYSDNKALLSVKDNLDGFEVYSVQEVKGLEFETVVVIPNGMSDNELYIAYTRALNELYLLDV